MTYRKPRRKHSQHPLVRTLLFTLAIGLSVLAIEYISQWGVTRKAIAGVSLSAFLVRGFEVLTDVVADRIFPNIGE